MVASYWRWGRGPVHLTGGNHEVSACRRLDVLLLGRNELALRYRLSIKDLVEFVRFGFSVHLLSTDWFLGSSVEKMILPNDQAYPNPNPAASLIPVFLEVFSPSPVDYYYDNMLIGTMKLRIKNEGTTFFEQRDLLNAENC